MGVMLRPEPGGYIILIAWFWYVGAFAAFACLVFFGSGHSLGASPLVAQFTSIQ